MCCLMYIFVKKPQTYYKIEEKNKSGKLSHFKCSPPHHVVCFTEFI